MIPWWTLIITFLIGVEISWCIAAKYWYEVYKKQMDIFEKNIKGFIDEPVKKHTFNIEEYTRRYIAAHQRNN